MINRKVLYGYQIQNGALEIVPEEQRTVSMSLRSTTPGRPIRPSRTP